MKTERINDRIEVVKLSRAQVAGIIREHVERTMGLEVVMLEDEQAEGRVRPHVIVKDRALATRIEFEVIVKVKP